MGRGGARELCVYLSVCPSFYSSSSMSISLSDSSQNPSEDKERDSKDSLEPSFADLEIKKKITLAFAFTH